VFEVALTELVRDPVRSRSRPSFVPPVTGSAGASGDRIHIVRLDRGPRRVDEVA